MTYLYSGNILRVDLSKGKISKEPTAPYIADFIGGRGINVKILYDEVPPEVAPLDPASRLIFGVGPLCGTPVPAPRTEVTAKSPENGFFGTSNFGGFFGPELKFAGYDNIVIYGKADKPVYLWIHNDEVEIRDAAHLWGKDTFETQDIIRSEVDPDAKVACIGQAGENLVYFATIQHELGKATGRTGMGCVMGSKNLKAIVVRGTKGVDLADPEKYLSIAVELQDEMRNFPGVQLRQKTGHSYKQDMARMRATKDQVPKPVYASDLFFKYQSDIKRAGCFGCPTQCMDLYPIAAKGGGSFNCSLYVTPIYWVKSNDLELLLEISLLCQRYGIDNVTSMALVGWLMELYENGIITAKDTDGIPMEWGSKQAIEGMFNKMLNREGIGAVLAQGFRPAIKKIGHNSEYYANQLKGVPLYDMHYLKELVPDKGQALGMVMSSRGDTMKGRGLTLEAEEIEELAMLYDYGEKTLQYDELLEGGRGEAWLKEKKEQIKRIAGTEKAWEHDEYEGKPEIVIYIEDGITICDSVSSCKGSGVFLNYPFSENYQVRLISAGSGVDTSFAKLTEAAQRVKNIERAFNVREGMTRDMDVLPKRFMDTPLKEGPAKGAVLATDKFEDMKSKYYALRGWDIATGIPTRETLEKLGLKDVARDLEKRGKLPEKEKASVK
ncbi:aldehyde ferredoxin oxidoreductase family protein [Chloroflexota bacterium]